MSERTPGATDASLLSSDGRLQADDPRVYALVEQRRQQWDSLLWQVPLLTFAGQAFLFTILLGPDTSFFGRLAAGAVSVLVSFVSLLLLARHRQAEQLDAQWLEDFEVAAGWPDDQRQHGEAWAARRNRQLPGYSDPPAGRKRGWGKVPLWNTYRTWVVAHWMLIGFAITIVLIAWIAPQWLTPGRKAWSSTTPIAAPSGGTSQTWCFDLAPNLCVEWVESFPYWEVATVALVTIVVTVITVRASVAAARRETDRVLTADAEARKKADAASEGQRKSAQAAEAKSRRASLARELIRCSRLVHDADSKSSKGRRSVATKAEWASLRVAFDTSGEAGASELFQWADLTLWNARVSLQAGATRATRLSWVPIYRVQQLLDERASAWAADPEAVRELTYRQLQELRAEVELFLSRLNKRRREDAQSQSGGETADTPKPTDQKL